MTEEEIENAALTAMANFGTPADLHIPDYGWIIKDGKVTEAGIKFYQEVLSKEK